MKHIPERTCMVCRKKMNKYLLNRYVYVDGKFILDEKQILPGRGFYICNGEKCKRLAKERFLRNL